MSISKEILAEYKQDKNIFIETGTYLGQTSQLAYTLGFTEIHTIEVSRLLWDKARQTLHPMGIRCWFGDSSEVLPVILKDVHTPAVFWLDGHYSQGITSKGKKDVPLYEELEHIKTHHIKNHTILIDDVRLFGNSDDEVDWTKISLKEIESLLLSINPLYKIIREDGAFPNDILVAYVE